MILRFLFILILSLLSQTIIAQNKQIDQAIQWANENSETKIKDVYDTLKKLRSYKQIDFKYRFKILEASAKFSLFQLRNFKESMVFMNQLKDEVYRGQSYKYKIKFHNTIGEFYFHEGIDQKKSYKEFKKALNLLEKHKSDYLADLIYSNYAIALQSEGKMRASLAMKMKALKLTRKKRDYWLESILTNNIAVNYLYLHQEDSAEYYFKYSYKTALKTAPENDETQRALFLGMFYNDNKKPDLALSYFNLVIQKFNVLETYFSKNQLYTGLSRSYESMKDYEKALINLKKAKIYADSAEKFNLKKEAYIYNHELKLETLKNKNQIEKERNQKFKLQIILAILAIFFLMGISIFLVIRNRKNKLLEKYRIENDLLEKEKLKIEKLIAEKENASKAMFLLEKDNLLNQISQKLKDALPIIKDENQFVLQGVINELKGAVNVKRWEEFELRFNKVNPLFFENLKKDFPNLTLNERKLCAFLSMQLSTKEISNITGQTIHSINIARGRLRKKLNINHTETELVDYLGKYN